MRFQPTEEAGSRFEISALPDHRRIQQVTLDPGALASFVETTRHMDNQRLDWFPYERFLLAQKAEAAFGPGFGATLRNVLMSRALGAVVICLGDAILHPDDALRTLTAIAYSIGNPTPDVLSGTYYARVQVKPDPENSPVFNPRAFWLHNDATIEDTAAEWVLIFREEQKESTGGDSTLLHLDEWEDLETFLRHPLATVPMLRLGPQPNDPRQRSWGRHLQMNPLMRPVFGRDPESGLPTVAFNQQFMHVRSQQEADYVHRIAESLAHSGHVQTLSLSDRALYIVNNTFWLHGRSDVHFTSEHGYRNILRSRGVFFEEQQRLDAVGGPQGDSHERTRSDVMA